MTQLIQKFASFARCKQQKSASQSSLDTRAFMLNVSGLRKMETAIAKDAKKILR